MSDKKIRNQDPNKNPSFLIDVNKNETENFMNDILKGVSKYNQRPRYHYKALFFKSFLLGFILVCLGLFFLYTSYYFVDHAILHRKENCLPLSGKL
jgi:hypothetical protein